MGVVVLCVSFIAYNSTALILLFYIYAIFVIYTYSDGTLSDPRLLLVGFYTFYSTFFALRVLVPGSSLLEIDYELLNLSLKYQLFGMFVFVTVLNFIIQKKDQVNLLILRSCKDSFLTSEKVAISIILILIIATIFLVLTSGVSSKVESNSSISLKPWTDFSFFILTAAIIIRAIRMKSNVFLDPSTISFILVALLYMLSTGERDIFFRIAFLFLLVYFDKNRNAGFGKLIIILSAIAIFVPFTQSLKAVLLTGNLSLNHFALSSVFSNEFISSGRNFYTLLFYGVDHDLMFLFSDFLRAFTPSIIIDSFNIQSTSAWFGSVYRVEHGFSGSSGWGFTLNGQGYLIGGLFGIVIVNSIYALIVGTIYNRRCKSVYWYVFYLFTLTTAIYVLRADMANFLSQTFKVGGLAIIFLKVAHLLFMKKGTVDTNFPKRCEFKHID